MSSGFVSSGTADQPTERDEAWRKAQQEIEEVRRAKEEQSRQVGGKSLYEVLEQNKAAKQEAFEESIRLKNQFRSLDEDEVDFLDTVLESTRAKEQAVKQETATRLELFREQQEEAKQALLTDGALTGSDHHAAIDGSHQTDDTSWAPVLKKRKRSNDKETLRGVKSRKPTPASDQVDPSKASSKSPKTAPQQSPVSGLGPAAIKQNPDSSVNKSSVGQQLDIYQKGLRLGLDAYSSGDDE